jgi:hypothetical protein
VIGTGERLQRRSRRRARTLSVGMGLVAVLELCSCGGSQPLTVHIGQALTRNETVTGARCTTTDGGVAVSGSVGLAGTTGASRTGQSTTVSATVTDSSGTRLGAHSVTAVFHQAGNSAGGGTAGATTTRLAAPFSMIVGLPSGSSPSACTIVAGLVFYNGNSPGGRLPE